MTNLFDRSLIEASMSSPHWDLGNQILYDLCIKYPDHKKKQEIIAKVWLIGRAYAVALERIKKKTVINDDFYIDCIAPLFCNSDLDQRIHQLKYYPLGSDAAFMESLRVHGHLVRLIGLLEGGDKYLKKRSFCSKYLHFHQPDLFYIYDSRAKDAIAKIRIKPSPEVNVLINEGMVEPEYAKFASRCSKLQLMISNTTGIMMSNRQLDNFLIHFANEKLKSARALVSKSTT